MQALTDIARESLLASKRIYPAVRKTRLLQSEWLSKLGAANVYLKLENEQVGCFPRRLAAGMHDPGTLKRACCAGHGLLQSPWCRS